MKPRSIRPGVENERKKQAVYQFAGDKILKETWLAPVFL